MQPTTTSTPAVAADGTADSCLLNLFEVSNDLGSAFLDGFAVGTHNKAA